MPLHSAAGAREVAADRIVHPAATFDGGPREPLTCDDQEALEQALAQMEETALAYEAERLKARHLASALHATEQAFERACIQLEEATCAHTAQRLADQAGLDQLAQELEEERRQSQAEKAASHAQVQHCAEELQESRREQEALLEALKESSGGWLTLRRDTGSTRFTSATSCSLTDEDCVVGDWQAPAVEELPELHVGYAVGSVPFMSETLSRFENELESACCEWQARVQMAFSTRPGGSDVEDASRARSNTLVDIPRSEADAQHVKVPLSGQGPLPSPSFPSLFPAGCGTVDGGATGSTCGGLSGGGAVASNCSSPSLPSRRAAVLASSAVSAGTRSPCSALSVSSPRAAVAAASSPTSSTVAAVQADSAALMAVAALRPAARVGAGVLGVDQRLPASPVGGSPKAPRGSHSPRRLPLSTSLYALPQFVLDARAGAVQSSDNAHRTGDVRGRVPGSPEKMMDLS